jgi:ribosomal-protein-alanine N-acetyltransferase
MISSIGPVAVAGNVVMRLASLDDAEALSAAYQRNREHLQPWEPWREEEFFTPQGQLARLRSRLDDFAAGRLVPWMLAESDEIVGTVTLTGIVLGPLCSASLGYWIDVRHVGRGLATAAVEQVSRIADEQLGLHRLEAGTLVNNTGSQRVLAKSGFTQFGRAPSYLHIDGEWRDHLLFQKLLNDRSPA